MADHSEEQLKRFVDILRESRKLAVEDSSRLHTLRGDKLRMRQSKEALMMAQ
jgi:hypothetical protein